MQYSFFNDFILPIESGRFDNLLEPNFRDFNDVKFPIDLGRDLKKTPDKFSSLSDSKEVIASGNGILIVPVGSVK